MVYGSVGDLLITSISCLLYFSGAGSLLIVRARTTLLEIPMRFSLDVVSLPSHMPGMKRCSIFGMTAEFGNM